MARSELSDKSYFSGVIGMNTWSECDERRIGGKEEEETVILLKWGAEKWGSIWSGCGAKSRWLAMLVCLPKGISREKRGDYSSEVLGKKARLYGACGAQVEGQPMARAGLVL